MVFTLSAATRTTKGEALRRQGKIPGIVYGAGSIPTSVALTPSEFTKVYRQAGEASIIDLMLDGGAAQKVLVQEVQLNPVTDSVLHVDLRRIDMSKPMTATVPLKFVGEAPAVKELGGTFAPVVHEVLVKCLPNDLVSHLDVDISVLKTFNEILKIKDLTVPAGIVILTPHADDLIAKVTAALTEDEIKKLEEQAAAVDVTKIEVVGAKEKEAAAAAEGEAAIGGKASVEKGAAKEEKK